MKNRQWLLARRPEGAIKDSDFNFVETEAPTPGEGQVLVRNIMLSCDPTQRGWIAFDTYLPAVKIGEVVRSMGAGRIVASKNPDFAVGDIVSGLVGWQDYVAMHPKGQLNKLPPGAPLEMAISVLGLTGLTAYFGLLDISKPRGNVFLDRIEEQLTGRGWNVVRYAKPTFTKPAPIDLRQEIAVRCDAVIEALAD